MNASATSAAAEVRAGHDTELGLDLAIAQELRSLVRPSFRRLIVSHASDARSASELPAAFDCLDHHHIEIAMREGQLRPTDFDVACPLLLQRHAASILCVALGLLLRRGAPQHGGEWLDLFALSSDQDGVSRQHCFSLFTPAQRFVIAMSLRLAARHCASDALQQERQRRAARRWWPRA